MHSDKRDIRVVHKLESIENPHERNKIGQFVVDFQKQTSSEPEFVIRSPGRINLIGDHVDYHGFSVLPMAIENSILMGLSFECAGSGDDKQIRIANRDSDIYQPFQGKHSFSYGSQLDQSHDWRHYVLCGYHGVLASQLLDVKSERVFRHAREMAKPTPQEDHILKCKLSQNLSLFIDSDLPPASGLSSSSALVCAAAVATRLFLMVNEQESQANLKIDSKSMATDCAKFEHLIGTHGGGMDQAVIITAQEGYAKHVEFMPEFRCTNVHLPESVSWLVSHCGSNYPKAATSGFNSRVLETKLAAAIILKALHRSCGGELTLDHTLTLGQIRNELFRSLSTADICRILKEKVFLHAEELHLDQICSRLELSRPDLISRFKTSEEFLVKNFNRRVKLLKRCLHVYQEAERVERFKQICDTTRDIHQLGRLMSESHASLRDQYECSHADLDRLVEISLKAGALGARLTGAGWGGCIVTMVEASRCQRVLEELKKVSKFTFQTEPRFGCTIIKLRD